MRDIDSETQAALAARTLVARNFIQVTGKSFATGLPETAYFWSDIGKFTASVVDGITGATVSHEYIGAATLLKIDDIPLTSDITVRTVSVTLSQLNDDVIDTVRGANLKQGAVQIHRGLFNPATRNLVAACLPRFVGFVNKSVITNPKEGDDGSVVLSLTSHTQELTRSNSAKCSDADQKLRNATDNLYQDMAVVGKWPIFWGTEKDHGSGTRLGGRINNRGGYGRVNYS